MAKIYKFEGYIVDPNGEDIDVEEILKGYGHTFMLKTHCGCEEFEWDDDLEVNNMDADYCVADKLYCQLGYDRVVEELRKHKKTWRKIGGVFTPGGDPAYECPVCGEGFHVYGIESPEPHKRCRDCGVELFYPWEVK